MIIISISIFLVKQHYIVDAPCAMIVAEGIYWIVNSFEKNGSKNGLL